MAAGMIAAPAMADHHLVKIAEVSPGSAAAPNSESVQLQMTSGGQAQFFGSSSSVTLHAADGASNSVSVNADVANGQSGRRVLIGLVGLTPSPDFAFAAGNYLSPSGGAACFSSGVFGPIDCVSWGTFTGGPLVSPTGGEASPTGITDEFALGRRGPDCGPSLIDTNNPSDWREVTPAPVNNAAPAAAGSPCPNTTITKKPNRKTTKRKAKFSFTATQGVDEFKCKLDDAPFNDCTSPFKKRVRRGKHSFKVKAAGDPTPASYSWKVVKK